MVDVSGKTVSIRTAIAAGRVLLGAEAFILVKENRIRKGDVLVELDNATEAAELKSLEAAARLAATSASCAGFLTGMVRPASSESSMPQKWHWSSLPQ